MSIEKMEIIYYEMKKTEQIITQRVEKLIAVEDSVNRNLKKFEILQQELIAKLERQL